MQYLQKKTQSQGDQVNQRQNIIDDSFLDESIHLDSESSRENLKTLINCKAEHTLSTKESCNSNSFTLSSNKVIEFLIQFKFLAYEILEWETLDNTLPSEVYNFLSILKCQCYAGTITYTIEQIEVLINQSQIYVYLIKNKNSKNLLEFLSQILDKGWIFKTIRIFNGSILNFYALAVKTLTFENLFWIIKSLKKDLITPTESSVQSRIKECYGLKYKRKEWNLIINQIKSEKSSQGKQVELPMIQVIQIKDPFIQEETQGIYIQNQNWNPEDEFQEDLYQKQEWNIFIEYLQSIIDDQNDYQFFKDGGYGCAQFIKLFGPKNLRELSLARLKLYTHMAINKHYIRNTKKVQYNREKSEYATDDSQDRDNNIKMKIEELKEQLIQLLLESQDGYSVSFTQIPKLLKKRVNFKINLIDLGFPKLRNFIESIKEEISIEKNGRNNVIVKLDRIKYWNQYQSTQQKLILDKIGGDLSNQAISSNILELLKNILSQHKYGISINELYYDLSQLLGEWFNFKKFQCQSFFQFLQNYAENILIIVCQKGNQYLIYERDLRFLPPPTYIQDSNNQQFDRNLSEVYQCNLGLSLHQSSFSNSWLGKAGDSQLRQKSLQLIEDSHQEIKENLKFIDEILGLQILQPQGYETKQNDTYSIQDWSEKSMNRFEMFSSINYGQSEIPADFDLTKELQNPLSQKQQIQQQTIQQNESKKK
ncbi:unnamed protein product (macronuclear) [Paramecium tetraurelia]|uniref:HTH OST-type domain-containing protein n=1 Tax=Paramecium tetraurelia TaxID=5888 RepID=A0C728_PARTE|nr:uncharacterized protein GSPATT00035725001 [Paramecium tetraurelia]CAK66595.1 unnamed protein product [Paramecium tetraurelia]|eukprot:XP_001433992.1 hypothetical protein (macronuclear) [Paramecium tetraurelia strain d4-2]